MTKRKLPAHHNHLLAENNPSKDDLVELRRLGQTKLMTNSKASPLGPGSGPGATSTPSTPQMTLFSYVHLRAPLPTDINPEIFGNGTKPEAYFLMRRSKDGYVSSTGMFKASFPWASKSEEEFERRFVKSHFEASTEETAGNLWIHPDDGTAHTKFFNLTPDTWTQLISLSSSLPALTLASEYRCRIWIEALVDDTPVNSDLRNKDVTPPPPYRPTNGSVGSLSPASGAGVTTTRSVSPAARKIAQPRKPRAAKSASSTTKDASANSSPSAEKPATSVAPPSGGANASIPSNGDIATTTTESSVETSVKLEESADDNNPTTATDIETSDSISTVAIKSELMDGDVKTEVEVETTTETKGDDVVESTHVKVEIQTPPDVPSLLSDNPEDMIAKAKEMVAEAMKDVSEPSTTKKRKIEDVSSQDIPDIETLEISSPKKSKRARVIDVITEENFQKRALIGIGATVALGKSNRIEIYDLVPEGLEQVTHFSVYGRVTALLSLRPQQSRLDHLFIGTDRYEYFTVSWDPTTGNIQNERKAQDVTDRFQRAAHSGHLYLADPEGRLLGLYLYEGIFTAIPIKRQTKGRGRHTQIPENEIGDLDEPCPIRMNELRIITMAFLYGTAIPVVAVLYKDSKNAVHITTYEVNLTKKAVKDPEFTQWNIKSNNLDHGAKILIPVPDPIGGVLVIGEQMVYYFHPDRAMPMKKPLYEPANFTSYGKIDSQRYLLSDETGHLYLLLLVIETDKLVNMKIENLGEACQARVIVYLDNGYTFLGSHFGDSLLVKISAGNPRIDIAHSLTNLAPISDFIVLGSEVGGEEIHQYSAGQTMILTCSGGFFDGGLRSVRSGVGIQDIGELGEMVGVQNMWSLKKSLSSNSFDDTLLFSFAHETRAFSFGDEGEVEELDTFGNFALDTTTLVAGNVGTERLVQVVPSGILLQQINTQVWDWAPPSGTRIDLASIRGTQLVVVLSGRICVLFDLSGDNIKQLASRTFENEISCVHIPAISSDFLVIGFWTPTLLALLQIPDLETIREERLMVPEGSVPRSIVAVNMGPGKPTTLFIGMADGEVLSYSLTGDPVTLSDHKRIQLGTQTVTFEVLPRQEEDESSCVIATGERPTMIYEEEGRMVYSAITLNQAACVVAFNAEAFPDTVVVAAEDNVFIAKMDEVRSTHTRTSPLHQFARRVAFSKEKRAYAVATIRNSIDSATGMESSSCYIHVIDENFYDKIDAFELQANELVESLLCVKLQNPDGSSSEKFIVGTAIGNENDESEKGRFLILELGDDKVLRIVAEIELQGACHSLATVKGYILTGLNKSIDLYRFIYPDSSMSASIERITSVRASTIPVALSVSGTRVFVGDLVKGVMVLELVTGADGENDRLVEVCRQYGVSWITALEALDEDTCISADSEGNLMLLRRESVGATDEDTRRMRPLSELRLGEMVNRIRKVNDPVSQTYVVQPKAYLGTVEGGLFMLGLIHPDYFDTLMKCQSNMSKVVKGVGDLEFNRYRAFNTKGKQPEEPFRFVDGELIEKFLDLDEEAMNMVINGLGDDDNSRIDCSVDEMKNIVEALKRLH
ncbi:hypothetical protein ABW20_dc0107312 [Dactylellina cionopaga]|nr:hypothetical protein ABW20_dc0107312 [Dactylellina cionopaga]